MTPVNTQQGGLDDTDADWRSQVYKSPQWTREPDIHWIKDEAMAFAGCMILDPSIAIESDMVYAYTKPGNGKTLLKLCDKNGVQLQLADLKFVDAYWQGSTFHLRRELSDYIQQQTSDKTPAIRSGLYVLGRMKARIRDSILAEDQVWAEPPCEDGQSSTSDVEVKREEQADASVGSVSPLFFPEASQSVHEPETRTLHMGNRQSQRSHISLTPPLPLNDASSVKARVAHGQRLHEPGDRFKPDRGYSEWNPVTRSPAHGDSLRDKNSEGEIYDDAWRQTKEDYEEEAYNHSGEIPSQGDEDEAYQSGEDAMDENWQ